MCLDSQRSVIYMYGLDAGFNAKNKALLVNAYIDQGLVTQSS